ncbi:pentatricopeptide repeat-containing protein At1g25360-like [Selaginella moellendorffii]|uniref:pentatricopeptide repeat-containing protein At1g25360-like n=1 Tax=Selaginella moellendorffii TaxID=88036 RepID=UPI000D1C93C7|nr:pentatricopeptide repeat-containing protein At1g25360-like [Selaginella moellendorffii]|eukprot:XP_024541655.1 pentatricopeptide repeat-containing protein At1g25360-like [Selaginella moellendorffii]
MLGAYSQIVDAGSARAIFDQMEELGLFSWNSMLAAYFEGGNLADAKLLFKNGASFLGRSCSVSTPSTELADAMLVRLSLGREGLLQEAENLFQGMKQRGLGSSFCEDDLSMVEERFWIKKFRTAQELIW